MTPTDADPETVAAAHAAPPPRFTVMKLLLLAFPLGLIVLGAASFGVYFARKDGEAARSARYAAALRRPLSQEALDRYATVIAQTLATPQAEAALAAFIESSTGAESMGYDVRRIGYVGAADPASPTATKPVRQALDIEVTGKQRPRELIVLAADYAPPPNAVPGVSKGAEGMPAWLGLAHATTGMAGVRSLRWVAVPELPGLRAWMTDARTRGERVTHIALVGALAAQTDAQIHDALGTSDEGVVLLRPAFRTLADAQALQGQLLDLAARQ